MSAVYEVQLLRGRTWRPVDWTASSAVAESEVAALHRGNRRSPAVRLLLDGVQVRHWPARRG